MKRLVRHAWNIVYGACLVLFYPINSFLAVRRQDRIYPNSALHISFMGHMGFYTVRVLRRLGVKADYLALGRSPTWEKCDYHLIQSRWPFIRALQEFLLFWKVVAKYEVIHCHFAMILSTSGWELPILKRMGRRLVIHYRGCEIRDRERNMALHPETNICQVCDYNATICTLGRIRRRPAEKYGDHFLVSTPDMKDFVPQAEHFPFFAPDEALAGFESLPAAPPDEHGIKIVHVTNHPGLEGTEEIREVIDRLKEKGFKINFVFLRGVRHERVLQELRDAALSVGKMKMGYYANIQIESMFLQVPAITYVRPEFMSEELRNSGFIFSTLKELEGTIEHYLKHPDELQKKRFLARSSIIRLHNNDELGRRLVDLYAKLKQCG